MRIAEMNWMMVEEYLRRDNRCVLPLGSTEQHAYLSLSVDSILAERLAVESAEPLGVPVFPVLAYGITPYFRAFPGTVTLRAQTYLAIVRDLLDSIAEQGFKRILIVNGHGGNAPAQGLVGEWLARALVRRQAERRGDARGAHRRFPGASVAERCAARVRLF
jgi:creatinine amidohydrolase